MRPQDIRRLVSAEDQDEAVHLLCEYLTPTQPPSEMKTKMQVARMVRGITWSADTDTFKKETRKDVWQAPPFFLEMRKGDYEDHSLLMCNLFLGLGEDAYVCVGRPKGAILGEKRHVWVLTRHGDGSVCMWESSNGTMRILRNRWQPPLDEDERLKRVGLARAPTEASATSGAEGGSAVAAAAVVAADDAGGRTKKKKKKGESTDAAPEQVELINLGDGGAGAIVPSSGAGGRSGGPGGGKSGGKSGDGGALENYKTDQYLLDAGEADIMDVMMDELLNRDEIEGDLGEIIYFDDDELAEMKARSHPGAGVFDNEEEEEEASGGGDGGGATTAARRRNLYDELASLPKVDLPYATLECIFNHRQLWVSKRDELVRMCDPALLEYDLPAESDAQWECFVEKREQNMGLPVPFYTPLRLPPKVAPDRLRNLEAQILGELETQIKLQRGPALKTTINKSPELVQSLIKGLELQVMCPLRASECLGGPVDACGCLWMPVDASERL